MPPIATALSSPPSTLTLEAVISPEAPWWAARAYMSAAPIMIRPPGALISPWFSTAAASPSCVPVSVSLTMTWLSYSSPMYTSSPASMVTMPSGAMSVPKLATRWPTKEIASASMVPKFNTSPFMPVKWLTLLRKSWLLRAPAAA